MATVNIEGITEHKIVRLVDLSDDSVNKIAEVVARKIAEPVRHGYWEVVDEAEPRRWGCSNCRCLSWHEFYYCPNCGAKMDEVEE